MNDRLKPICVDLDGTLIFSDTLLELLLRMIKYNPLCIFFLPIWLFKGRSVLKYELSLRFSKYINKLPINEKLLEYLKKEKESGREIVLVTACDENLAKKIVAPMKLFSAVYGSTRDVNLKGALKADFLCNKYGELGFAYAGNSLDDIKVWERSDSILIVNASNRLIKKVSSTNKKPILYSSSRKYALKDFFQLIRVHQWTKNILIFLPLFLSHNYANLYKISECIIAFLAFSLCASATYIVNDLFDIEADRSHSDKKNRPLASGKISISSAFVIIPSLLLISILLASILSCKLLAFLGIYIIITLSYSFYLKKIILLDVILLAILYMFRVEYGAVAIDIIVSFWLASFSIFFFLSLAFLKRYVEISKTLGEDDIIPGRGYLKSDKNMVSIMGICAGMISVLLFVIYIDASAKDLYGKPTNLMYASVLLIYFLCNIWMAASRGKVHSDPIVYAIKAKESYFIALLFIAIFFSAQPIIQS